MLPAKRSMDAERADVRMDAHWKRKGSKISVLRAQGTEFHHKKFLTEKRDEKMSPKGRISSRIRQSGLKWLAVFAILAAFICSLWINFGIRAKIEANDRTVGLFVDYDELMRIADGAHDIDFADMLRKASLAGATGIVVRERLLAEWETAGDIIVFSGGQLEFYLKNQGEGFSAGTINDLAVTSNSTYILTKDPLVHEQLFSLLETKTRYPETFAIPGYMGIAVQLHSSERATLGMGFPLAQLEEAAAAGFQIIPRLRNWEPVNWGSIRETFRWVAMIPNMAAIGFNEQTVPGDGTNWIVQDLLAEAIVPIGKPLVSFEFYDQIGLSNLASRFDYNLMRVHAISDNEIRRYTDFDAAMDRYSLAATERNIRIIYLRFQGLINPAASMESNLELIEGVREGLEADGLIVGEPTPIRYYTIGEIPLFFLGVGVIAAGGWLLALAAENFAKKKWRLPYAILMLACCAIWAALIFIAPYMSRKAMAFAGAVLFPSLSVVLVYVHKPNFQIADCGVKRALYSIAQILVMSVMTLIGAMIMSAIMAETIFMLKLDMFRRTKISHIAPLLLVPCILLLREKEWFGIVSGTVKSNVKFWHLFAGAVLLVGLVVYVLRTGNEAPELVSEIEVRIRQILKNILGVRPRTKEFLIGHPITIVVLYYGYKLEMFPLVMVGIVGQVSIINTYAHLHTPLLVSLLRSTNGIWIGILIGVLAILLIEWVMRRVRALNSGVERRELREES